MGFREWLRLYVETTLTHEAIVFFLFIVPGMFLCLVVHLQIHVPPWGAILFYLFFIPVIVLSGVATYLREHKAEP